MRLQVLVLAAALTGTACTTDLSITLTAAADEPDRESATDPAADLPPPATVLSERLAQPTARTTSPEDPDPGSAAPDTDPAPGPTTTEPEPILLGFAGDVNMVRGVEARRPVDAVADLLSAPDLMMLNLETVIGTVEEIGPPPIPKEFVFRSPPETLDQLAEAGVDVVGLANNHSWDHGPRGVLSTAEHVAAGPVLGVGVGADPEAAYRPVFVEVDGRTVGVVSLTRLPCDWSNDPAASRPEIAYACDRFATPTYEALAAVIDGSDIAVVLVHAGEELADCPSPRTREVITSWVQLGIDVVSVSHPHVLGGIERVGDGVVLWSTGNFAFVNGGGRTARSAVFEVTVGGDGIDGVRVHPTVLPGAVAAPAGDDAAAVIRAEIGDRSPGMTIDDSGAWVPDPSPSLCDP